MRRSTSILGAVLLLLLVTAAPALAAAAPRIHDSGNVNYAYASSSICSGSTCTDTYINVFTATLDNGDKENVVCVDTFTYPTRGRGGSSETHGCGPASSFTIANDSSSATLGNTTITDAVACTSRRCSPTTITIGGTFTAAGSASSYSYRSTFSNGDCTERYSVKGTSTPATFQGTLNGSSVTAGDGAIGKERYNFSSTCVFGPA
jgi:hypothetical protein